MEKSLNTIQKISNELIRYFHDCFFIQQADTCYHYEIYDTLQLVSHYLDNK